MNGKNIISIPLISDEIIRVGYIAQKGIGLSAMADAYIANLRRYIATCEGYK